MFVVDGIECPLDAPQLAGIPSSQLKSRVTSLAPVNQPSSRRSIGTSAAFDGGMRPDACYPVLRDAP